MPPKKTSDEHKLLKISYLNLNVTTVPPETIHPYPEVLPQPIHS